MSVAHFFNLIFSPPGTRKSLGSIFILNVLFRQRMAHDGRGYSSRRQSSLFIREIGPARNRFPRRELLAQLLELGRGAFVSIVAKQKMVWRFRGLDRLDDRVRRANRITRLFAGNGAHLFSPRA